MVRECDDRVLLQRTMLALLAATIAVVICYFWIDRPVAFFVDRHHINTISIFRWLTYPPPTLQWWSPAIVVCLIVLGTYRKGMRCQRVLLVSLLSLIVADQFRVSLGDVFGRYWPETWFDHNPSLIGDGTYGFHPFQHGDDIGSFPSGHACRILAFCGVWWMVESRSRLILLVMCPPMLLSLVAMDYHFVGDVIAGSVLGGVVAAYALRLAGLDATSAVGCPGSASRDSSDPATGSSVAD